MIDFNYQPGNSFLHKLEPAVKFSALLIVSIFIILSKGLYCIFFSFGIVFFSILLSNQELKSVFSPFKKFVWFLFSVFLMNVLFSKSGNCDRYLGIICLSSEGIMQGFLIVLRTFAITVLSIIFIKTTTTMEIMRGLEKIMKPLAYIGVPTRDISLIMSISLQFIPIFFNDFERIKKAQTVRGADFTQGSLFKRIKIIIPLIIPAFISAFRRADELSLAIEARGFKSEKETRMQSNYKGNNS